ncbi:MAG: hypothetical protein LKF88_00050 [Microbacteriaceae bacterium]|jgi:hypothetical protein|nr:hypothetical protein [Microbacteriaceae bacterium]MCI1207370.1 hypothetical protein [Microbacteriaceae bacterium]
MSAAHARVVAEARKAAAPIDPSWNFDEEERAQWLRLSDDIEGLAEAVERADAQGIHRDEFDEIIDRAGRHAEDIDDEWFICGTEQTSRMLYGEQARWASLAHAIWNLTEVLLEMRAAQKTGATA